MSVAAPVLLVQHNSSVPACKHLCPARNAVQPLNSSHRACCQLASALSASAPIPTLEHARPSSSLKELSGASYYTELQVACHAVRLASKICRHVQNQLKEGERTSKDDSSPVTIADYAAQATVAWCLRRSLPAGVQLSMVAEEDSEDLRVPSGRHMLERITELVNFAVVSENEGLEITPEQVIELIDLGASPGGNEGRHWVLDPIDGTRGFVGLRQYSVCLGMLQDGEVALGVLGCPNLRLDAVQDEDGLEGASSMANEAGVGTMFLAHRNLGAYQCPLWEPTETAILHRIHVDDSLAPSSARYMESVESRHSSHGVSGAVASKMGLNPNPLRIDSQVKYGVLSRGAASIFMRFPPATYKEKIWDHAAGFVIVEEAGGKVTDARGRRLDFSKGRYLEIQGGIIAGPPSLHDSLVRTIAQVTGATDYAHL